MRSQYCPNSQGKNYDFFSPASEMWYCRSPISQFGGFEMASSGATLQEVRSSEGKRESIPVRFELVDLPTCRLMCAALRGGVARTRACSERRTASSIAWPITFPPGCKSRCAKPPPEIG